MDERTEAMTIPNILAARYAKEMVGIWSPEAKIIAERHLWLAVLEAQIDIGVETQAGAFEAYEAVVEVVDLESIAKREAQSKHDVKARIEEFNALAGFEVIHRGMTSRDLTDNVEQVQIKRSMELVRDRCVATLALLAELAVKYAGFPVTARTHNVPAQVTTMGKRLANYGEELFLAYLRLEELIERYPLRGIKGAVGTQQDMLDLLDGGDKIVELEERVAAYLGFNNVLESVGQVYPRSLDFEVVSALVQVASAPANFAKQIRLMAGHDLATEGFLPGQVGSSAMPHKMNARSCERIGGFLSILKGHLAMTEGLVGDQWNEGDVSDSVVRRVALPDSFFTIDGLFETFLTVLGGFGVYPAVAKCEFRQYLPFLGSTKILMACVREGIGRETAHGAIKEHAVAVALEMRELGRTDNDLLERLGGDDRIPFSTGEMAELIGAPIELTGAAAAQVYKFSRRVETVVVRHPEAALYVPESIL